MLEGKVAFVTGGGSGIGAAAARLLAEQGAKVVLISRTKSELEQVVSEIKDAGGEATALEADVSKSETLKAAIDETVSNLRSARYRFCQRRGQRHLGRDRRPERRRLS